MYRLPPNITLTISYIELLKEEKSDIDLIGPTLQSLKTLLDPPPTKAAADSDSGSKFYRVVHGLLSACLTNIDEMRYAEVYVR